MTFIELKKCITVLLSAVLLQSLSDRWQLSKRAWKFKELFYIKVLHKSQCGDSHRLFCNNFAMKTMTAKSRIAIHKPFCPLHRNRNHVEEDEYLEKARGRGRCSAGNVVFTLNSTASRPGSSHVSSSKCKDASRAELVLCDNIGIMRDAFIDRCILLTLAL